MDEPGCFSTKSEEYFQYSQPCRGPWLLSLYSLPYTHILIFQASICKVARWILKKNLWKPLKWNKKLLLICNEKLVFA